MLSGEDEVPPLAPGDDRSLLRATEWRRPSLCLTHDLRRYKVDPALQREIDMFVEEKRRLTMTETADETAWRSAIRTQLEAELNQRVRDALHTPPPAPQPAPRRPSLPAQTSTPVDLNARLQPELSQKEQDVMKHKKWKALQTKRRFRRLLGSGHGAFKFDASAPGNMSRFLLPTDDDAELPGEPDVNMHFVASSLTAAPPRYKHQTYYAALAQKVERELGSFTAAERLQFFHGFTKSGFKETLKKGHCADGTELERLPGGRYRDRYGIVRSQHGPFWPSDCGPLFPKPSHERGEPRRERLREPADDDSSARSVDQQTTEYSTKWRGVQIVFDSEKTPKEPAPPPTSDGQCPGLQFESRFESGNLRQARRVGQFEYELVLKTDLYTQRHTQWFYFRVRNALPHITYKFTIVNLLKRDSLYNHGMRPLMYSEDRARLGGVGWARTGHHVRYVRNTSHLQCPLLSRERIYYTLEWQNEFPGAGDTYYFAHCYPYTFTDLRDDLDAILADPERSQFMKREVMCETRAGNSCFLLTVTDFESKRDKKAVVVSARVHPGETNSSWMMKGLLDFITSSTPTAQEVRHKFLFKIVPMLNPDGVIVGNYRCSLAGRDLNRNYRHPRKESFPTVWATKRVMDELANDGHKILVYCDFHGHSRKQNVFMYGCNTNNNNNNNTAPGPHSGGAGIAETYLRERLFPWLMSQKAPDKFWFRGCKFQIRRCKESTGRVVMFRQMQILNSFTMEATFCGSNICRGERRHFNTSDFLAMGRTFAEVLLDYSQTLEDKSKQSEVILDLTKALTQQFLEQSGVLSEDVPDISTEAGRERLREFAPGGDLSTPELLTAAFLALVRHTRASVEAMEERSGQRSEARAVDVERLVEGMATPDHCYSLLEELNVLDVQESDSSDSDSESDPEMPQTTLPETTRRPRRRKKKHKKRRSDGGEAGRHERKSSVSGTLPAITSAETETNKHKVQSGGLSSKIPPKLYPGFVNKYVGRSNGGIPCFSEERLMERAAKRVVEMKKRFEEQQKQSFLHNMGPEYINTSQPAVLHRSNTVSSFNYNVQGSEITPAALYTSYVHTDGDTSEQEVRKAESETARHADLDSAGSSSEGSEEEAPHRAHSLSVMSGYSQPFLQPLPRRANRLPTMYHQSSPDLTPSHDPRLSGADPRLSGPDPRLSAVDPRLSGPDPRLSAVDPRLSGALPVPRGALTHRSVRSVYGMDHLARRYTDVLSVPVNRVPVHHPNTRSHQQSGHRHSTCE